jgi:predicted transcriptional regulator
VTDIEKLLRVVPVGEESAETALQIWQRFGLWAPTTIRYKLNHLAAYGRIKRKSHRAPKGGETYLYYRT